MIGTIYRWNPRKGMGNVATEDGTIYYVHWTAVKDQEPGKVNFTVGDRVTFDPIKNNAEEFDVAVNIRKELEYGILR